MQAPIEVLLTLEVVAEHFQEWRSGKKNGERIPERLWREAVSLVDSYGVSQVCRALRLSGTDLNERRGVKGIGERRRSAASKSPFVEVERASLAPNDDRLSAAMGVELERPDGARLRIQGGGVDLLAVIGRFLEGSA
jgi:hypothetical protein